MADWFVDHTFPPSRSSLVLPNELRRWRDIEWCRASKFRDNPELFGGDISPVDIVQGELEDCYFLSALSALAERPAFLRRLFRRPYQPGGPIVVQICKDGLWEEVELDDTFPCRRRGNMYVPCFSFASGGGIWVAALEKAYAKIHGSYAAIERGATAVALTELTGAPADTFDAHTFEEGELFRRLQEWHAKGFSLTASTSLEPSPNTAAAGLVYGHAYSILDLRVTRKGSRYLRIRNPWGKMQESADGSTIWTRRTLEDLDWPDGSEGVSWISQYDFIRHFHSVTVLYLQDPTWQFCSRSLTFSDGFAPIVELTLQRATDIYLTVWQADRRRIDEFQEECSNVSGPLSSFRSRSLEPPSHDTCEAVSLEIYKKREFAKCKSLEGQGGFQRAHLRTRHYKLSKGRYLLKLECLQQRRSLPVVLAAYSNKIATLRTQPWRSLAEVLDLSKLTRAHGVCKDYGDKGCKRIVKYKWKFDDGCCFWYENGERNKRIEETLVFDWKNLRLEGSSGTTTKVSLGPGSGKFLLLRKQRPGEFAFKVRNSHVIGFVSTLSSESDSGAAASEGAVDSSNPL